MHGNELMQDLSFVLSSVCIAASNGNKGIMAIKKITQKIHDIFMIYSLFIMKKKKKIKLY